MMIVQKRQNHVELNGIFPPGLYMFQQVTWDSIVHPRAISTTVALIHYKFFVQFLTVTQIQDSLIGLGFLDLVSFTYF